MSKPWGLCRECLHQESAALAPSDSRLVGSPLPTWPSLACKTGPVWPRPLGCGTGASWTSWGWLCLGLCHLGLEPQPGHPKICQLLRRHPGTLARSMKGKHRTEGVTERDEMSPVSAQAHFRRPPTAPLRAPLLPSPPPPPRLYWLSLSVGREHTYPRGAQSAALTQGPCVISSGNQSPRSPAPALPAPRRRVQPLPLSTGRAGPLQNRHKAQRQHALRAGRRQAGQLVLWEGLDTSPRLSA